MHGASSGTVRHLRVGLVAITLLLAALVLARAFGPVFAEAQAPSTAVVSSVVFADRDDDGQRRRGRARGRGRERLRRRRRSSTTDAGGGYELETDVARRINSLVYITQPAGRSVGVDEYMTPRFFRNLGPARRRRRGHADFALTAVPASRSNSSTFANVTDPTPTRTCASRWRNHLHGAGHRLRAGQRRPDRERDRWGVRDLPCGHRGLEVSGLAGRRQPRVLQPWPSTYEAGIDN